jgi:hypothetical protein
MKKIPTLSKFERFAIIFLHLLLILPIILFIFGFIASPSYYFNLIETSPNQPLGWLLFIFIILIIGLIIFLVIDSIGNIERRPVYKSLLVYIVAALLDTFIIPVIILLPVIYMVLSIVIRR